MSAPVATAHEDAILKWVVAALDGFKASGQTAFRAYYERQPVSGSTQKGAPRIKPPCASVHMVSVETAGHPWAQLSDTVTGQDGGGQDLYRFDLKHDFLGNVEVQTRGVAHRDMARALVRSIRLPAILLQNRKAGLSVLHALSSVDVSDLAGVPYEPRTATEFRIGFAEVDTADVEAIETVDLTLDVT